MNRNNLKVIISIVLLLLVTTLSAQSFEEAKMSKKGEVNIFYFENEPYAYKNKKGELVGIEVDIMHSFVNWMLQEKGIELKLKFIPFKEFAVFYNQIQHAASNTIGLGSVTISDLRKKEVSFSAPYLKNVAVLVTDGTVPTARNLEELNNDVLSLAPVTIKGSMHQTYLEDLYAGTNSGREYVYVNDAMEIPIMIKESAKYFGYVDVISFWKYVKSNKEHYIKMHSIANKANEEFGFVLPKTSDWDFVINEFFESGFGFTATKEYHSILEKHLGFEIIEKVEIN